MKPFVVHIPHASLTIPDHVMPSILLSKNDLDHELLVMTDRYTDELFGSISPEDTLQASVSRLVVDVERFPDQREMMERKGMGAVYRLTHDGEPLRSKLDGFHHEALMRQYYWPHHAKLTGMVNERLEKFDRCLIIDCHSFSPEPLPHELDQDLYRPDTEICIGTDEFHTPSRLKTLAKETFRSFGYHSAFNRPFGGTMIPEEFFEKDKRVHGFMIEVRRNLYMNCDTGEKLNFDFRIQSMKMADVVKKIIREWTAGGEF